MTEGSWHERVEASVAVFRSLVLHDLGRYDEALAVALTTLAPSLPEYRRAVSAYAQDLLGD